MPVGLELMSRYISYSPVFKYNHKRFQVNGSERRPFYTNLMKRIVEQLEAFLSYHARAFVLIIVLSTKKWTRENALISELIAKLMIKLKGTYKFKRVGYVWCREQASSSTQHYHLSIILDGAVIQYPAKVINILKVLWKGVCNGNVSWPENCYYHFQRTDQNTFCDVIYRLSYLAKVWTKGKTPKFVSMFGASRIKLKE